MALRTNSAYAQQTIRQPQVQPKPSQLQTLAAKLAQKAASQALMAIQYGSTSRALPIAFIPEAASNDGTDLAAWQAQY